jgi:hypothetical protein
MTQSFAHRKFQWITKTRTPKLMWSRSGNMTQELRKIPEMETSVEREKEEPWIR